MSEPLSSKPRLAVLPHHLTQLRNDGYTWVAEEIERQANELGETHARVWELQERVAKEIEANARLTAELSVIKASCAQAAKDAVQFQDERDRLEELTSRQSKHIVDVAHENGKLRAALEKIAAPGRHYPLLDRQEAFDVAREALAGAERGHTCHNGATIYLLPGKKCQWCDAENEPAR